MMVRIISSFYIITIIIIVLFVEWYPTTFRLLLLQPSSYSTTLKLNNADIYNNNSMPVINNDHLAMRLQQNWMTAAPHPRVEQLANSNNKESLDDSLTSLNWLQNWNMSHITSGCTSPPVASPLGAEQASSEGLKVNPNQVLATNARHPPMLGSYRYPGIELGNPHLPYERIDYRNNPYVKPPYSYASLICMAMKEHKQPKITLSAIYNWITENFMYYRMADPSWQVRITNIYITCRV